MRLTLDDVRVVQLRLRQRAALQRHCVVGLLVLPPADVADEPLVVERDALAAEQAGERAGLELQVRLVDLGVFRVGNDRPVGHAVGRAVVGIVVTEHRDIVRFHECAEAVPVAGHVVEAAAQGGSEGIVRERILVDRFQSVPELEVGFAARDGVDERDRLRRCGGGGWHWICCHRDAGEPGGGRQDVEESTRI